MLLRGGGELSQANGPFTNKNKLGKSLRWAELSLLRALPPLVDMRWRVAEKMQVFPCSLEEKVRRFLHTTTSSCCEIAANEEKKKSIHSRQFTAEPVFLREEATTRNGCLVEAGICIILGDSALWPNISSPSLLVLLGLLGLGLGLDVVVIKGPESLPCAPCGPRSPTPLI